LAAGPALFLLCVVLLWVANPSIGGANANGAALAAQVKLIASDVTVVVLEDTGHWILEERPEETISALSRFLEATLDR